MICFFSISFFFAADPFFFQVFNSKLYLCDDQVGGVLVLNHDGLDAKFFEKMPRAVCLANVAVAGDWLVVHEDENWTSEGPEPWTLDFGDVVAYNSDFKFIRRFTWRLLYLF